MKIEELKNYEIKKQSTTLEIPRTKVGDPESPLCNGCKGRTIYNSDGIKSLVDGLCKGCQTKSYWNQKSYFQR